MEEEGKNPKHEGVNESKEELLEKLQGIVYRYRCTQNGKPKTASVAKLLSSNLCERRIIYLLVDPSAELQKKFDRLYTLKSEYATLKILDHLKHRLVNEGVKASIATEVKNDFGVHDVTIVQGNPCRILRNGQEKIKLEIKASLGVPLEQIERYLWDPSPLILVRVITGQVVMLNPSEMKDFVLFSMKTNIEKAKRLLDGKSYTVPGIYCLSCPDLACQYNRYRQRQSTQMIKMNDFDFGDDFNCFFRNLPYVAEKTAKMVVIELTLEGTQSSSEDTHFAGDSI